MEVEIHLNNLVEDGNISYSTLLKSIIKPENKPKFEELVKKGLNELDGKTLELFTSSEDYDYLPYLIQKHPDPKLLIEKLKMEVENIKVLLIRCISIYSKKIFYSLLAEYDRNIIIEEEDIYIAHRMFALYGFKFNMVRTSGQSLPRIFEKLFYLINVGAVSKINETMCITFSNKSLDDNFDTVLFNKNEIKTISKDKRTKAYPDGIMFKVNNIDFTELEFKSSSDGIKGIVIYRPNTKLIECNVCYWSEMIFSLVFVMLVSAGMGILIGIIIPYQGIQ